MKRLGYSHPHDLNALHEELIAALGDDLEALALEELEAADANVRSGAAARAAARAEIESQIGQGEANYERLRAQARALTDAWGAVIGGADTSATQEEIDELSASAARMDRLAASARQQVAELRLELRPLTEPQPPDVTIRVEDTPDPDDDVVWITVPDATDELLIEAIVEAHDPAVAQRSRDDKAKQREDDLAAIATKAAADPAFAALTRVLGLAS